MTDPSPDALRPEEAARGTVLVAIPHMDDEALACGGTLAGLPDKDKVRFLYATSGRGSEGLRMPGARVPADLDMGDIRRRESLSALRTLGYREDQARFLDIPDYQVERHAALLRDRLAALFDEIRPDTLLTPFRYDRHTDHVALSRISREVAKAVRPQCEVLEYFVYYRWKLLPRKDVRAVCRPDLLARVDIAPWRALKKEALQGFVSQTTLFFPWQTRPVLSRELIDEECLGPEIFLRAGDLPDRRLFTIGLPWVRLVHGLEPALKTRKDQVRFLWDRALGRKRE